MRKVIAILFVLCGMGFAALPSCTKPIESIDTALVPKVLYVDQNDDEAFDCINEQGDTLRAILSALGGTTGSVGLSSVGDIKANIDRDSNTTGSRFWVANHTNDTLFRVADDSSAKFTGPATFGKTTTHTGVSTFTAAPVVSALTASLPVFTNGSKALASNAMTGTGSVVMSASPTGTGTWSLPIVNVAGRTTLSDSLIAVSARWTGNIAAVNGTFSGTLGVTGVFALGGTSLSGPATVSLLQNSAYNTIDAGTHTNILLGGNSTYGNFIGTTGGPAGPDFTPTGWGADVGYVDNSALVASVLGGHDNISNSIAGIVVGGGHNFLKYNVNGHGIIGGGSYNVMDAGYSGIFSGRRNTITGGTSSDYSFIGGGDDNNIVGDGSAIISGTDNDVNGGFSVVSGTGNRANGYSYLFGNNISAASYSGVTAFTDGTITTLSATANNQFLARFANGYTLNGGAVQVANLTASQAVFTDASKNLVSVATTGSGNVVCATSPTLAGANLSSDVVFTNDGVIRQNTSDASDTRSLSMASGGSSSGSRGATQILYANEHASLPGFMRFIAGDVSGAEIQFYTASTKRAHIDHSGNFNVAGLAASRTVITDGSSNLTTNTETGSGSHVRATSPTLVTPALGAATATSIVASGNVTADSLISSKFYTESSFTATATGLTTSPSGAAKYVRVGKQVTIILPSLAATSNSTAFTFTGLPAALIPAVTQEISIQAMDNTTYISTASVEIRSDGGIRFSNSQNASGWTSSGTKGLFNATPVTYTLQ